MTKSIGKLFVLLVFSTIAWAQDGQDISRLVAKVDPSVVMISMDNESLGSGFVIDESGLIATNYHVIEGAKTAVVTFPANKDKTSYPVKGYVAIKQSKDLALIRIDCGGSKFPALKLALGPPAKGDKVFAFGSPLGLSGSVSDGMVSALRTGREVSDILMKIAHEDVYKDSMGYDMDAQWLQITAPISPGNSGGPLVNNRGEVIGINTWVFGKSEGQNLNFSISATHLRQLNAEASVHVRSLTSLPKHRNDRRFFGGVGDPQKTLGLWKRCNELKNELNGKLEICERKFQRIPPPDPLNANKGRNNRLKKFSDVYAQAAKAYEEYADKLKALDNINVDSELVDYVIKDADLSERYCDTCKELLKSSPTEDRVLVNIDKTRLLDVNAFMEEIEKKMLKEATAQMRTEHDILRRKLSGKYKISFPTLEDTKNIDSESGDGDSAKNNSGGDENHAASTGRKDNHPEDNAENLYKARTWTDRSGKYQVQAKFLGIEEDKVKLEKSDGKIILVRIKSLSEADRRFIGAEE